MICYIKNVQNIKCIQTNDSQTNLKVVNEVDSLRCTAGTVVVCGTCTRVLYAWVCVRPEWREFMDLDAVSDHIDKKEQLCL